MAIATKLLENYEFASGQKINYSKSPALYLGIEPPPAAPYVRMQDDDSQRLLGLNIGVNQDYQAEFTHKMSDLNDLL